MGFNGQQRGGGRSWRFLLAIFCVLLVAVTGTLQVAHIHADGADAHANCSLCAVAHVTLLPVQTPAPAPPAQVVAVLRSVAPVILPSALSTFALFTRPPPAGIAAA